MCSVNENEDYAQRFEDYFAFVNTDVYRKLLLNDEVYVAYGSHNKLPVENIRDWYREAEQAMVPGLTPEGYIAHKYGDHALSSDDVEYFIDKEIGDDMLYENMGYWFRA